MAVETTIEEGRWSTNRLRAFLAGWVKQAPTPGLTQQPWERTPAGPWTWFFGDGCVRGCSLAITQSLRRARALRVRVNSMGSRTDWALAHSLLRGLLEAGGGRLRAADGAALTPSALSDPDAGNEALAQLRTDAQGIARALRAGEPFAALPNPEFSLIVTPALLPAEADEMQFALTLEDELVEMARRYHAAESLRVMALPDGTTLSVWSQGEALLPLVHHLGLSPGDTPESGVVLPAATVLEALGDRVEVVSEDQDRFYLPALEPGRQEDAELLEELLAKGRPLQDWLAGFQPQMG